MSDAPQQPGGVRMLGWLWISLLVVVLDQWTKQLASAHLALYQAQPVFPGFNLTLMHNSGAAFSFLRDAGGWQRWFFLAIAAVVAVVVVVMLVRQQRGQLWLPVALALILGGAIGNFWDRALLGYVVDFIEVYYQKWYFPAFNIADSAISVGAAMLIIDSLRPQRSG